MCRTKSRSIIGNHVHYSRHALANRQLVHRTASQQAPKELLEISPLGKSPVITDGEVTLAESGAITGAPLHRFTH